MAGTTFPWCLASLSCSSPPSCLPVAGNDDKDGNEEDEDNDDEANGGDDVYKFHFEMFQFLQRSLLCAELTGKAIL